MALRVLEGIRYPTQRRFRSVADAAEGLERWHVPTIMTLLPLFLQASLVFFFV